MGSRTDTLRRGRIRAILEALLVTFLWSTSWVLIKRTLDEIPALVFAGLRYGLAALILLPGALRHRDQVRARTRREWGQLTALGLVFYTLTQGGQFLTLNHLEAVTFSLLLNFSAVLVAFAGIALLGERPAPLQWTGIAVFIAGVLVYFSSSATWHGRALGLILAGLTVSANATASLLSRYVNREQALDPVAVTCISMGIGAAVLLALGLATQGWPAISPGGWLVVAVLAVVNSAFAFTLWNRTLVVLTAVESSVINNTMLIQIAVLAWLFLGERPTRRHILGLVVATAGILLVQVRHTPNARQPEDTVQRSSSEHTREQL